MNPRTLIGALLYPAVGLLPDVISCAFTGCPTDLGDWLLGRNKNGDHVTGNILQTQKQADAAFAADRAKHSNNDAFRHG
jgi:hypothetical protein